MNTSSLDFEEHFAIFQVKAEDLLKSLNYVSVLAEDVTAERLAWMEHFEQKV